MKKNNKLLIILLVVGVILVGLGAFFLFGREHVVSLKDDFYNNINHDVIKDAKIPSNSNAWSTFYAAGERVAVKKDEIAKQLAQDPDYTDENSEAALELINDYEGRNARGISELKTYFDSIDNAKNIEELNNALIKIQYDLDVQSFINFAVTKDFNDSSKKLIAIVPATLESNFEYYTLDKFSAFKDIYVEYRINLLKQYGYSDEKAKQVSDDINSFIAKVQSKSLNLTEVTDVNVINKKYTLDEIKANIHNLPLVRLLELLKINNLDTYVVYDMEHMKALDALFTNENLDTIKEFLKVNILEGVASQSTTEDYLKIYLDYVNKANGTSFKLDELKEQLSDGLKSEAMGIYLYIEYEHKYFTDEDKKNVIDLINDIRDYYRQIIENCEWLEAETKEKAITKIDNMTINVGLLDDGDSEFTVTSKEDGGTVISNVIDNTRRKMDNYAKNLGLDEAVYDDFDVNAMYNPQDNSINIPAGFYEILNGEKGYYQILGSFGFVIGHEISHAFDSNGAKFDETGTLNDWWTATDKEKYDELTKKIVSYYNNYSVQDVKVDGEKTLNENIADLAAMKAILYIAEQKKATTDDYKTLFESYANLWARKIEKENLEKEMLQDVHSPHEVRVNAVLASMDKFYEVYDISEKDDMYVAPDKRVSLW